MASVSPAPDIIVVGASGGGVEAVSALLATLPPTLPAAVVVVIHRSPDGPSMLVNVLGRVTTLPVTEATDGAPIEPGQVYVPPADHHVLVDGPRLRVVRGAKEHGLRPAIDPLFRSAARWYGRHVVGVVLTGSRADGTAGLHEIKKREGIAIVQDPAEAAYPGMPRSALENVAVDHIAPLRDIAPLLIRLIDKVGSPA